MLFSKRLGLAAFCLSLCGSVSTAQAQFNWNPFASKKTAEPAAEVKTTASNPFRLGSSGSSASKVGTSSVSLDTPVSETTRRLILEESRHYVTEDRARFVSQFANMTEAQARDRLQQVTAARLRKQNESSGLAASNSRSTQTGQSPSMPLYGTRSGDALNQTTSAPTGVRRESGYSLSGSTPSHTRTAVNSTVSPSGIGQDNPWGTAGYARQTAATSQPSTGVRRASESVNPYTARSTTPDNRNPFAAMPPSQGVNPETVTSWEQYAANSSPSSRTSANPFASTRRDELPTIHPAVARGEERKFAEHYQPTESSVFRTVSNSVPERSTPESLPRSQAAPTAVAPSPLDLQALIVRAEVAARDSSPGRSEDELQQHVTRHVELRMLYLLAGQRERAVTAIPAIDADEQQFWIRVFWGLAGYLDAQHHPDRGVRSALAIEQMRHAIQSLQGRANLSIRSAAFCTDIQSFGDFVKFEREEFSPGQELLVYSELDNFRSERTPEGQFRTVLKSAIRVFPAGSRNAVDEVQYNTTEDYCRSFRQDFMQGFKYRLPQRLAPGAYVLQLSVEDQLSGKSADYSLNFTVR